MHAALLSGSSHRIGLGKGGHAWMVVVLYCNDVTLLHLIFSASMFGTEYINAYKHNKYKLIARSIVY